MTMKALSRPQSAQLRMMLTAVLGSAAIGVQWMLHPLTSMQLPFVFFLAVLVAVTVLAGRAHGALVLIAGLVNAVFVLPPTGQPAIAATSDRMALLVLSLLGVVLVLLSERVVRDRRRARAERLHMKERAERTQADLQCLHALGTRAASLNNLDAQLHLVLQMLMERSRARCGAVALCDPHTQRLAVKAEVGFGERRALQSLVAGAGECGLAFAERRRVVVEDLEAQPTSPLARDLFARHGLRAAHCIPLQGSGGATCGVIALYHPQPHLPDEHECLLSDLCAGLVTVLVERAHAQAAARAFDQRFRLALDSSAVPFGLLVPVRDRQEQLTDFRWAYVNSAAARVLQVEPGMSIASGGGPDEDMRALLAQLTDVAELDEARAFEQRLQTGLIEGWFQVMASPLNGAVVAWFADVTQSKRDQQALQEADRRKDAFLATLSHELRNPLAPIRQAVSIARMPGASEAQKRWSHDVIDRQVGHLTMLLDDLLDVSRITHGALRLRMAPVTLAEVVGTAVETASPLLESRAHRLLVDMPADVRFETDPLRVAQILGNLLTNAAKYTEPGGTIRLKAEIRADMVQISVIDNGIGIAPDKIDQVFAMFNQVRDEQDHTGGLGVGLALARGLAELHGGSLEAESEGPGRGSCFTLRLPLRPSGAGAPEPPRQEESVRPARRILVADDNRDAAETLAEFLRLEGHTVQVAYDGLQALAGIKSFEPEIALLDIGMPGLSGNEVAQRARVTEAGSRAALVAVTGWGQDKDRAQALASGFGHHLTKPVDMERLRVLLQNL